VTVLADLIIVKGWPASGAVPHHDEIEHDVWIDVSAQQVVGEQRNSIVATTFTDALGDELAPAIRHCCSSTIVESVAGVYDPRKS